jgi:starch-binding outer membrane protein, SusD/RagB family
MSAQQTPSRMRAHSLAVAALAAAVLATTACDTDDIIAVDSPDFVSPSALQDTSTLGLFTAGALSDFQVGYGGGNGDGLISAAALFTDEFIQTESFPTRFEIDTRSILRENTTMATVFLDLSRARASAERAARRFAESQRPTATGRLTALNIAGFSYILFAEHYCSGVPFSTINPDNTITFGEGQTTEQMLQIAIAKFDTVLAANAGDTARVTRVARIGRARALLNLGQFAQAGQAVAGVPTEFQYLVETSENSGRQNNNVWALTTSAGRFGVADREGGNGLPFVTAADARYPNRRRAANGGNGFDGGPMQEQLKYPARTTSYVLADGVEARLIEAEAALQAGNVTTFLSTLNALRTRVTGLAPLTDPGNATGRQNLLFQERAYWLSLTAHRLGDLRRLVRQYGRTAESVFPSGNYSSNGRTGVYGTDVNFPIPINEALNPSATTAGNANAVNKGCIDRRA